MRACVRTASREEEKKNPYLRSEKNNTAHDDGRQHGAAHHQPPVQADDTAVGHAVEGQVGDVAQHDAEGGPHLPLHDEGAAELGGRALGGEDGRRGRLGADAETQEEPCDEHVPPGVGEGLGFS